MRGVLVQIGKCHEGCVEQAGVKHGFSTKKGKKLTRTTFAMSVSEECALPQRAEFLTPEPNFS